MIFGARVRQARELRGLTQVDLARRAGIAQPTLAQIEAGTVHPSEEVLSSLSKELGFPASFFARGEPEHFPLGSLLFRARRAMTSRQRTLAHRYAEVVYEAVKRMSDEIARPAHRLPSLKGPVSFQEAASLTRNALGLSPDGPIRNLVGSLERAGVLVLRLPVVSATQDAYSLWTTLDSDQPVIVLFQPHAGDRLRFSVAHEVGHLVLHASVTKPVSELEQEADAFASEFLLPEGSMRIEMPTPVTLSTIAVLKPRWGVAIQTLIRRARDLEIITPRQYKYLFEQIGKKGWRTQEPRNLAVPIEVPRAFRKMTEMVYGNPPNLRAMAVDLDLSPLFLKQLLEGHAPAPAWSDSGDAVVVSLEERRAKASAEPQ